MDPVMAMAVKIGAAYVRVSTDDQLEYSPDSQVKVIRDYAAREGYVIPDEYLFREAEGISGKKADKRPEFRIMIATAKQDPPPFEAIFVWKFSRFARNQEEAIMYKNLLRKRGISVISVSEPSSDSPFSSLIERIIEWMDEYYLINLASEVRRGRNEKVGRGEWMGKAPFGYSSVAGKLVPNDSAATVRYIFDLAKTKGPTAIARILNEEGIKSPEGRVYSGPAVKYILANPVYIGKIRYSPEGKGNYKNGYDNCIADRIQFADGIHEPIIDIDTWNKVQDRLAHSSRDVKYVRQHGHETMLKGLLRCSACGATLTPSYGPKANFQCAKYRRGLCSESHYIPQKRANELVLNYLEELIQDRAITLPKRPILEQKTNPKWDALIKTESSKLDRATQALLDGALTAEQYKDIRKELETIIAKLEASKQAEIDAVNKVPLPDLAGQSIKLIDIMRSPDIPVLAKNAALKTMFSKIVFNKKENTLDFYLAE